MTYFSSKVCHLLNRNLGDMKNMDFLLLINKNLDVKMRKVDLKEGGFLSGGEVGESDKNLDEIN